MPNPVLNTTSISSATVTPDAARELIADALAKYAASHATALDADLAEALAANVKGWTHTTRLREFLDSTVNS